MKSKIKFFLWRWFICPHRVYFHLMRWSNRSAAVIYIRKNTGWQLQKCAEYVDNRMGRHVWHENIGCTCYQIGPFKFWEHPRIAKEELRNIK